MTPSNYEEFESTLNQYAPPVLWSAPLKSLWHDAKGDWESSHDIAQELKSQMGSWIHAYLHRKEGDKWNAGYWYERADKPFPEYSFKEELRELVEANL
ncbi:MAG: hypothetical protein NXH90_16250 [Flavobacteriaceae bacterium]|nr:hypothetical protein [Flavobacteriaceae bacterium]